MSREAILAIDQGTTGSRAILYDKEGRAVRSHYQEFPQYYPRPGWVEHDPEEIWQATAKVIQKVVKAAPRGTSLCALGITNQRETTVLWDARTGKPLARAIVWQDRRTTDYCLHLRKKGIETLVRKKTGLIMDPYFSATKVQWLLERMRKGGFKNTSRNLCFGTIDAWLIWKLTGGKSHVTDYTNASRTLLFNIRTRHWDEELMEVFGVPRQILPRVLPSYGEFGRTEAVAGLKKGIPIRSVLGDQQAALYGQGCYHAGEGKNTYGTGCFVVVNIGSKFPKPPQGLLVTVACDVNGRPVYALEGSVFIGGAVVQWLRDGLGFFKKAAETERIARKVKDSGGVVMVPAFVGLGSPYWQPHVRGMITGLTRGTRREHFVRAALESIAQQTVDVIEKMEVESTRPIRILKADGGATANRFLMQLQADLLGKPVMVSDIAESTAWGTAKLAGRTVGIWKDLSRRDRRRYTIYRPMMRPAERKALRRQWQEAIKRVLYSPP